MQSEDFSDAPRNPWPGRVVFVAFTLAVLGGLGFVVWQLATDKPAPRPKVQQVAILRQQPPPPPPKPPEKPPEPPKVKEEVKIDQPKPPPEPEAARPVESPPERPLGLDADGSAGSDGFGLAANRGGRDITTIGSSAGGGGGALGRYYTGLLQRNFFEALARSRKAPQDEFSVIVRVWLSESGTVARAQVVDGSGNAQLDELIVTTLSDMAPLREVPPPHLREVRLRLNRRS